MTLGYRLLSVFSLLCFLAIAVGCSSEQDLAIVTNPDPTELDLDTPLKIKGFTRTSGEYQEWPGTVRSTSVDSLLFTRSVSSGNAPPGTVELTLARDEVASIRTSEAWEHTGKAIGLSAGAIGMVVAVIVLTPVLFAFLLQESFGSGCGGCQTG